MRRLSVGLLKKPIKTINANEKGKGKAEIIAFNTEGSLVLEGSVAA
jgi:hypothetical protein